MRNRSMEDENYQKGHNLINISTCHKIKYKETKELKTGKKNYFKCK